MELRELNREMSRLLQYGLQRGLLEREDLPYAALDPSEISIQVEAPTLSQESLTALTTYTQGLYDADRMLGELAAFTNDSACFYAVRDWDRDPESYAKIDRVRRAARIIYLNKTCYNGLFRVNSAGEFNTPFGRYKNPGIVDEEGLRAVHRYFAGAQLHFSCTDYAEVLDALPQDAFVYLDPPYGPVSDTANFTGYAKAGFGREEQLRLRECCDRLTGRGVRFMLSNSATAFIREQYAAYHITVVSARRAVNSNASKRGHVEEVVIRNYE